MDLSSEGCLIIKIPLILHIGGLVKWKRGDISDYSVHLHILVQTLVGDPHMRIKLIAD
jgi:hypothetical protein